MNRNQKNNHSKNPNLITIVIPYKKMVALLILLTVSSSLISLATPKIIAQAIDIYNSKHIIPTNLLTELIAVSIVVFVLTYLQSVVQTYTSEIVARDLRQNIAAVISRQSFAYVQKITPAKLLTNLTSDTDSVKLFVSQAIGMIIAAICLIIGASTLLIMTEWKLGLIVLLMVPIIGGTFSVIIGKVRKLFVKTQKVIDSLNSVINESILGSSLIRVLHSETEEAEKFTVANRNATNLGMSILGYFSILIPIITLVTGLVTLAILTIGGHYVITGDMTLGDLSAFNSYAIILFFPIMIMGFMSGLIARSSASYTRLAEVLQADVKEIKGDVVTLQGDLELHSVNVKYGDKYALRDVTIKIPPKSKVAVIGPTAAGKTQLLYTLSGLITPESGEILYNQFPLAQIDMRSFHSQVGFVFQDSILFNMSIRENIAFSETVSDKDLEKAIETAELTEFVNKLPHKLNTVVSERGTTLSGGQKQRIMLARALAINPKILLLDDFTARVDLQTERTILANVAKNYPETTLISVTQKISSVVDYDEIILLMEGEVIAAGKHEYLLRTSPEYAQLYESQHSINQYEIQS